MTLSYSSSPTSSSHHCFSSAVTIFGNLLTPITFIPKAPLQVFATVEPMFPYPTTTKVLLLTNSTGLIYHLTFCFDSLKNAAFLAKYKIPNKMYSPKTWEKAPLALVNGIGLSLKLLIEQCSSTPTLKLWTHLSTLLFSIWSLMTSLLNPGRPQTAMTV